MQICGKANDGKETNNEQNRRHTSYLAYTVFHSKQIILTSDICQLE